jgi:hypothetical protein
MPVRFQREDETQNVGPDQDNRDLHTEFLLAGIRVSADQQMEDRRDHQGNRAQHQHRRTQTRSRAVESLDRVPETAGDCAQSKNKQDIADDRAGNRRFDDFGKPLLQTGYRNDQFRSIAEGRVEQSADSFPSFSETCSVAFPISPASGTMARAVVPKTTTGLACTNSATIAIGMKTSPKLRIFSAAKTFFIENRMSTFPAIER